MTGGPATALISTDSTDRRGLARAVAAHVADLPHRPRLLGLGEPMHGEDEFGRIRNELFAALVDRAGFTSVALETSAWQGRLVDAYVRGGAGDEDEVLATGFSHGFGESPANRTLVRWLREQNRHRPRAEQLRFAGADAPVEMMWAPSPRPALQVLHTFLREHAGVGDDLSSWDVIDGLLGAEEPWAEPAAAMDPARSIGRRPQVGELRAITDDLCRALDVEGPRLRRETDPDELEDAGLAARTAAGLLAYHAGMARDTDHRWAGLSGLRDTMMAQNLRAIARRGPALVFAHNTHLRSTSASMSLGPMTIHWHPAGAHLADRLGEDYRVIACALGEAAGHDIPAPPPDTIEGVLHHDLPPGNHLLSAPELQELRQALAARVSPTFRYAPVDDMLLGEVDEILFVRTATGSDPAEPARAGR